MSVQHQRTARNARRNPTQRARGGADIAHRRQGDCPNLDGDLRLNDSSRAPIPRQEPSEHDGESVGALSPSPISRANNLPVLTPRTSPITGGEADHTETGRAMGSDAPACALPSWRRCGIAAGGRGLG